MPRAYIKRRTGRKGGYPYSKGSGARMGVIQARRLARSTTARRANIRTGGFAAIEYKFKDTEFDINAGITNSIAGSEMGLINSVDQGDTESTRDGRKIGMTSIHVRGQIFQAAIEDNGTVFATNGIVRLALVMDTQANGAAMNAEDCFKEPTAGFALCSLRNLQYTSRFRVLKDITVRLPMMTMAQYGANLISTSGVVQYFEMNYKFPKPQRVTFKGTGSGIADIVDNSIYLLAWTDSVKSNCSMNAVSRVRFLDG